MSTRINVMISDEVLEELRKRVPERQRSAFINEATRERLRRDEQRRAFLAAAGSWNDPSQAKLDTDEGIQEYLDETRRASEERLKRLDEIK